MLSVPHRSVLRALTLSHLTRTDWDSLPIVHIDTARTARPQHSVIQASFTMLQAALNGDAELLLFLEDDLRFNRSIRHNLEHWLPIVSLHRGQPLFASLYNPGLVIQERGYANNYLVADPACYFSSQAILLSRTAARYVIDHWSEVPGLPDFRIGRLAAQLTPLLLHHPSLVQHVGFVSCFGHPYLRAHDFSPDWRWERDGQTSRRVLKYRS
jgi:hypothetical protein